MHSSIYIFKILTEFLPCARRCMIQILARNAYKHIYQLRMWMHIFMHICVCINFMAYMCIYMCNFLISAYNKLQTTSDLNHTNL